MSNLIERRDRLREAVPHLASASGSIASFQTDMRSNLEEIKIHFNPVQASGTPSPTNVLPISGWTGAVIGNTAKNFFDTAYLADASHYTAPGAYGYTYTDVMYLKPNTEYVLFATNPGAAVNPNAYMVVYIFSGTETAPNNPGSGKSLVNYSSSLGYGLVATTIFKFTTGPLGALRVGVKKGANSTIQDAINTIFTSSAFQIELGSTATEYEPYVGNQIPVSWSSLGTVYGGWVNESGEVWQAWTKQHLDGTCVSGFDGPYTNPSRYRVYTTAMSPIPYISTYEAYDYIVSDKFGTAVDTTTPSPNTLTYNRNRRMLIGVPDTYTTKQDAIDWINGMGGFDVSYLLATPVLVGTISPIALKTLVGANNIWSNANGAVEVKYWKH